VISLLSRIIAIHKPPRAVSHGGEKKLIYEKQEYPYFTNNITGIFVGMLVGGLAGALTMLLLAPQSGKDTRMQIRKKGMDLRDRTSEWVEETVAKVRTNANKITTDLKKHGQKLAVEQLDHVSEAAQAGQKIVQSS
jgi:gas vesicle protein